MKTPTYKIAIVTPNRQVTEHRVAFLAVLRDLGHEVRGYRIGRELSAKTRSGLAKGEFPDGFRPDVLLLFCMSYCGLSLAGITDAILPYFPYVTMWDSNPLRFLYFLKNHQETHVSMLVFDSQVVQDLHELGYPQASYFPYAYTDPGIFNPGAATPEYAHEFCFAGTLFRPKPHERVFVGQEAVAWGPEWDGMIREFCTERLASRDYLDVYRFLRTRMNVASKEGVELSDRLLYHQKWNERELLFRALTQAGQTCHVYGGFQQGYRRKPQPENQGRFGPKILFHPFLDKHTELPALYRSGIIHLCCTQFPRACHERVFQATASGAFMLHEWKDDVPALYEPDREIVLYRDVDEVPDLARYYLTHEAARRRIAQQGYRRFMATHAPAHRARAFLQTLGQELERYRAHTTTTVESGVYQETGGVS
jgi:spore maturation protein CgeB